MKAAGALLAGAVVLAGLLASVPVAQAAAEAVPGIRALVVGAGDPAFIELRFRVSPDDPDQDVGSHLYNVTVDGGSGWVNLGDTTTKQGFEAGDGFQTFLIELAGATGSFEWNITADDGTGPIDSACTVTIDSGVQDDYDACGTLDTTFTQYHCLPRSGGDTGFNYETSVSTEGDHLRFEPPSASGQSLGALNLAGDSGSEELEFTVRAEADLATSQHSIFWSALDQEASAATAPSSTAAVAGSVDAIATTGSHSDGVGVMLSEFDNNWRVQIHRVTSGSLIMLFDSGASGWTGGDPNDPLAGVFRLDAWAQVIFFSLGTQDITLRLNEGTGTTPGNLSSLWFREVGGNTFPLAATEQDRTGDNLCLNRPPVTQGGGAGQAGVGAGQGLPGFEDDGGFGGAPQFPSINFSEQAEALGMVETNFGFLLVAILIVFLGALGFVVAGAVGGFLGFTLSLAMSAVFNLMELWILVLVFLAAAAIVVLFFKGRGA